jgi:L-2-hydroxyglutarate oxidase LhgO
MKTQCIIISAGIIGLSIAREFALKRDTDHSSRTNNDIGLETSFRNSAVIHAGVYYSKESLKAHVVSSPVKYTILN